MKRLFRILLAVALLGAETGHGASQESCTAARSFSAECTQLRVLAADADHDDFISAAEAAAYFGKFDWPVRKAVAGGAALQAQIDAAWMDALDLRGADLADAPYETTAFLGVALYRNRLWRAAVVANTKGVVYSASRRLGDGVDPRGGADVKPRPVVLAYREDRVSHESGVQLFGSFSATFLPWVERPRAAGGSSALLLSPALTAAFDVDTASKTRGKNSSDISIGPALSLLLKGDHDASQWSDHYFTIAPSYLTDADFDRRVVNLAAGYSLASTSLGRPGLQHVFCTQCRTGSWIWSWRPSLQLIAGKVYDAGGNPALAHLKDEGAYLRVVPTLSIRVAPADSASSIGLDWQGLRDDEGRYRSYREFSYQYDIRSNLAFTAVYRKGTRPSSFQYVDAILFGLGFQYP